MAVRMGFAFTLASIVSMVVVSSLSGRASDGLPMLAAGLATLILAAVLLIDSRIDRSESSLREQILRLEVRLVDLAESVAVAQGPKQSQ
jgi:hypothetical protein